MDSKQQLARPISTKTGGSGGFDGNASFEVYYSPQAGAVPFLWESAPGKPKNAAADTATTKATALPPTSTKTGGGGGGFDGTASYKVYYRQRSGAVPFQWESAPGTPNNVAAVTATTTKATALRPISTKTDAGEAFHGNAPFKVYYSQRSCAVPFQWESAPGAPKNAAAATTTTAHAGSATMLLPALSPPPSCQSFKLKGELRPPRPAGGVVRTLLGVLGMRKSRSWPRRHHPAASKFELPLRCLSATGHQTLDR